MKFNQIKKTSLVVVTVLFFAAMMSSCHRETCPTYGGENTEAPVEQNV